MIFFFPFFLFGGMGGGEMKGGGGGGRELVFHIPLLINREVTDGRVVRAGVSVT